MLGAFGEVVDGDRGGFPNRLDVSERNVTGYVESLLKERLLNQLVSHHETQVRRGRRTRGCRWLRRRQHVGRGANVNRLGCDVRRRAWALRASGRLDGRGFRVVGGIGVLGSPRIREAQSAFVGRAAAFAAPLHSRAIILVVALRLERALAIDALVFWTRGSKRFCGSCCRIRCIWCECIRMLSVLMLRTCYTLAHGICTLLVSVDAQVLCIACSIRIYCRQFGAILNHSERKPCKKITAEIESKS